MGRTLLIPDCKGYLGKMVKDARVVTCGNPEPHTYFTFSLCSGTWEKYADKDLWDYLPHDPSGRICFIEQFASVDFSRNIFRNLEKIMFIKHPQIEQIIWFRPGGPHSKFEDRKFTYRRRYETCLRHQVFKH